MKKRLLFAALVLALLVLAGLGALDGRRAPAPPRSQLTYAKESNR